MLFPSTLVICHQLHKIDPLLLEIGHQGITNNPDIFVVSEYTVENIRQIKIFLSKTPYSHDTKVVVIPNAELLNVESQNTLLKNLEEPGENNYFILVTTKPNSLLPTIISRCHTIKFSEPSAKAAQFSFPSNLSESLLLSESLSKDKDLVLPLLENLISEESPLKYILIQKLIKATQMLRANIDSKTVLDYLFLSL